MSQSKYKLQFTQLSSNSNIVKSKYCPIRDWDSKKTFHQPFCSSPLLVRLSIIGSHCVCWLPKVRGNCGLCNCEFFADDGRTLGNMSRIKTPMYCLAKQWDNILCKKSVIQKAAVYYFKKGLFSYRVSCLTHSAVWRLYKQWIIWFCQNYTTPPIFYLDVGLIGGGAHRTKKGQLVQLNSLEC